MMIVVAYTMYRYYYLPQYITRIIPYVLMNKILMTLYSTISVPLLFLIIVDLGKIPATIYI